MVIGRRELLGGTAVAAGVAAAPAKAAEAGPEVRWRCTSSYPRSLDTIYAGAEMLSRQVAAMTDGRFQIQVFAPGEIVPGLQAMDAVTNGTVEMAHTSSYYYWGKDPTFAFPTAVPFGLNSRMQNAWMYDAGGIDLCNEFFQRYRIYGLPLGNTGCQMGGWFRREIGSLADLQGVKMRIGGFGGQVLAKVGVVPQQIAGGDIYPALERGTIDAAEWVGPYDDERLGFYKVARYYYYPGFWEGGAMLHAFINLDRWNELPKSYQAILANACGYVTSWMQARYDSVNPGGLKRLIAAGAILRPFPADVMDACLKAAQETYAEIAAQNADFKRVHDHLMAFRGDQYLWWQVAEYSYDSFMIRSRTRPT